MHSTIQTTTLLYTVTSAITYVNEHQTFFLPENNSLFLVAKKYIPLLNIHLNQSVITPSVFIVVSIQRKFAHAPTLPCLRRPSVRHTHTEPFRKLRNRLSRRSARPEAKKQRRFLASSHPACTSVDDEIYIAQVSWVLLLRIFSLVRRLMEARPLFRSRGWGNAMFGGFCTYLCVVCNVKLCDFVDEVCWYT